MTAVEQFARLITTSLADGTFIRLTLTRPVEPDPGLDKVLVRPVDLKQGPRLLLTYRYPTRDITKHIPVVDAGALVARFRGGRLCTLTRDWQLANQRLMTHKPSCTTSPSRSHDVAKAGLLDDSAHDWLHGLGVVDTAGKVRPAMADKYRQIAHYLEIVSHLVRETDVRTLADMGCGKGYLTFAIWHLLHRVWGRPVHVLGLEARPELAAAANRLARAIEADGLEFLTGDIATAPLPAVDALVALHACDTATDQAICRGVQARAQVILVAPCCHKEARPQLGQPAPLGPVLAHGIMAERMAEWTTDGLRALALEWAGYATKVIEFVGSDHTPKNLLIAGVRRSEPFSDPAKRRQYELVKEFFGIQHHALDELGHA